MQVKQTTICSYGLRQRNCVQAVKTLNQRLFQVTWTSFYLFLFFLPLYEAPKNIFSVFFLIFGLTLIFRSKNCFPKNIVAWSFLVCFGSAFLPLLGDSQFDRFTMFRNSLNWSIMPAVGFVFIQLRPTSAQLLIISRVLSGSLMIGIIWAFIGANGGPNEINSVGHINQSALFVVFGLAGLSLVFVNDVATSVDRWVSVVVFILGAVYISASTSVVAFGGLLIVCFGFAIYGYLVIRKRFKFAARLVFLALFLGLTGLMTALTTVTGVDRQIAERINSEADHWSGRDKLLRSAVALGSGYVVGAGIKTFGDVVTWEALRSRLSHPGSLTQNELEAQYFVSSHGHGLFTTSLIERGWVGVLILFGFCLISIPRVRRESCLAEKTFATEIFYSMPGALLLILGMAQTTLHNEHGQLAIILIGCFSSQLNVVGLTSSGSSSC